MTNSRARRLGDPRFQQEQGRYEHPIPSRELILRTLAECGSPLDASGLEQLLDISQAESPILARRLAAMVRDGQLVINRRGAYLVAARLQLVSGRVTGHPDGYGFLCPDEGGVDLYLPAPEMKKVMHGDRILASPIERVDRRGRREARVVEVIERRTAAIVGRIRQEGEALFLEPADRRISQTILIRPDGASKVLRDGDVAVVNLEVFPDSGRHPIGTVGEILGHELDPGIEIELAVRKHDLPHVFPDEVQRQAIGMPKVVRKADLRGRTDLRNLPLITIDGENARDFDDAVWATRDGRDIRLIVAIADVSHYVKDGSPIDIEARLRGTSVYFPRRVIPMLPEQLSNQLCSLNPGVDRLCLVCELWVGQSGRIKTPRFYPAIMHSHARLTYEEANGLMFCDHPDKIGREESVLDSLSALKEAYRRLHTERQKRGAIDFESTEISIAFDQAGKIAGIAPVARNEAHRVIEECMLAANVCAADLLEKSGIPGLYRVHEGPTEEKLAGLREFLKEFGLQLRGGEAPSSKDYAQLIEEVKSLKDKDLIQTVLLRSLSQARYSPDNVGHFGLAYESYVHFTSPIRRYPDLLVHRAIKSAISGTACQPEDWVALGLQCSQAERRADDASRDVESWLKCHFVRDRAGECFDGVITGVASFGIFVLLAEVYVEGMVHVSDLGADYFLYDAKKHQLRGERTGETFRISDRVRVRVMRVDVDQQKVELALDEPRKNSKAARHRQS